MRNLKKILALALALVMSMSLMTVANATSFSDDEDIEHQKAVEVLTALGVLEGKGNNTFDPNGYLTRAEIAKLITIITLGDVDVSAFMGVATDLTDINGHWAEGYIKYCYSQGIISGRGNGRFDPNDNVTAVEAAKTLLTAIGYNSDVQGYEGAQWAINVTRDAQISRFYEELSVTANEYLTRDDAAQMVYNAIDATMIERTSTVDRTDGSISDHYGPFADGRDLLSETFEAKTFIGTFTANSNTRTTLRDGEIRVEGCLDTEDAETVKDSANFPSDLDISNIGEEVKVIFKDATNGTRNRPDRNDTIYGVFNTGNTEVINATLADIDDQKSDDAKITVDDTDYDTEDTVEVITNYRTSAGVDYAADNGSSSANSALTTALKQDNGNTVKFVCNDEGKIERAYVVTSKIAAVTAVNNDKITMNNSVGTIDIADNDVYEDAARGDVVVVTTLYAANAYDDGAYNIVEPAEVVSGNVTSYKNTESVTVDGTVYELCNHVGLLDTIPSETPTTAFDDDDIGEDFDLYLVNGFVGAAIQTSESANNYSLVLAVNPGTAGAAFNALQLQVMDAEGVTEIIYVSDDSVDNNSDGDIDEDDYNVGDIIVYTGDVDDAVVTVKGAYTAASGSYSDSTKTFNGDVTAANCVLFVETTSATVSAGQNNSISGAKYKVYNIRDLDSFTAARTNYVLDDSDRVVAVFADLTGTPAGASSNTVYGIVTAYVGRVNIDDTRYYQYTVASNDETYTVNLNVNTRIAKGDLVSFDPVSDEIYGNTDVTPITSGAVYVKEYSETDGTLTFYTAKQGTAGDYEGVSSTQRTLALDDEAQIIYVNADGDAAGSDIGINPFDGVTGYKNAVIITDVVDGADVIQAIFVETSNECDILAANELSLSEPTSDELTAALASNDVVTVSDFDAAEVITVTVPANKTLVIDNAAPAENSVVTVAEGAAVQFISGNTTEVFGKDGDVSVDDEATITVTATGMKFECDGTVTFNVNYKFHKDNEFVSDGTLVASKAGITLIGNNVCSGTAFGADANFYASAGNETTAGVKEAFAAGVTYTWATVYTDNAGTTAMGWVRS